MLRRAGELVDVEAEGFGGGDAAGGGVRLFEQAGVGELGHLVADGGGAHGVGEGRLREGAGADGLAGRDVALDDGGEDLALAGCDGTGHSIHFTRVVKLAVAFRGLAAI